MAPANIALVRRAVAALNERDAEGFVGLVVEDFEWTTPVATVESKTYRGADGVRQFFADARTWESIEGRADDIRDLGDRALMLGEISWRGPHGSFDVSGPLASVVDFEAGKIKRIQTYRTSSDALAAVGLQE